MDLSHKEIMIDRVVDTVRIAIGDEDAHVKSIMYAEVSLSLS